MSSAGRRVSAGSAGRHWPKYCHPYEHLRHEQLEAHGAARPFRV